jgi:hypothetical protein
MKNFIVTAALLASAAVAQATPVPQASPIEYAFSYVSSAGTLTGTLMGELQADDNTILVSSVLDFAKFNGVDGVALSVFSSLTTVFGGPFQFATTTLDGSAQDIYAATANGSQGFALVKGVAGVGDFDNSFISSPSFGNGYEAYAAANWSINAVSAVPEPTSLLLAGLGLAVVAASRRRAQA